jgi:hypothetical protein
VSILVNKGLVGFSRAGGSLDKCTLEKSTNDKEGKREQKEAAFETNFRIRKCFSKKIAGT